MIVAAALAAVFGFAPPLDQPIRYRTVQTIGTERFSKVNELVFARAPGGYRVTVTLTDASTTASAERAALFDVGMAAFRGVPITLRLGPDGRLTGVVDQDGTWRRIVAGLDKAGQALAVRAGGDGPMVKAVKAHFTAFANAGPDEQAGRLMEDATAILAFSDPGLALGETRPREEQGMRGSFTLTALDPSRARYRLALAGADQRQSAETVVDRTTGLVESDTVIVTMTGPEGEMAIRNTLTRER